MLTTGLNRALAAVIASAVGYLALSTAAMAAPLNTGCTSKTITGVYTYGYSGYSLAPDQTQIPYTISGLDSYDGHGHVQGVYTETTATPGGKASVAKAVTYKGLYSISSACVISVIEIDETGAKSTYDEYTGPAGSSISFVETDGGSFESGTETRNW